VLTKLVKLTLTRELKNHAMKMYVSATDSLILNLGIRGNDDVQIHSSAALPPEKEPPGRIMSWVGPDASMDAVVKRKIPCLYRDSKLQSSNPYPVAH
jgi:hypothetical protein